MSSAPWGPDLRAYRSLSCFGDIEIRSVDEALLWAFVVAVACAILAIFFFAAEVLMTGKGVRAEVAATKRSHT